MVEPRVGASCTVRWSHGGPLAGVSAAHWECCPASVMVCGHRRLPPRRMPYTGGGHR
jgi:hypothetical protein